MKVYQNVKANLNLFLHKYKISVEKAGNRILDKIATISAWKYIRTIKAVFTRSGKINYAKPKPLKTKLTSRTGNLVRSILGARNYKGSGEGIEENIREIQITSSRIRFILGTKLRTRRGFDYPKHHEDGQRPFLKPAFDDAMSFAEDYLQQEINQLGVSL